MALYGNLYQAYPEHTMKGGAKNLNHPDLRTCETKGCAAEGMWTRKFICPACGLKTQKC